ncbi:MAG: hypothetical protein PUD15_05505 [Prevotella sp.]|uniref:hypothetical protein n=1 Tax=Prevotella sp. AGR2160 TaxID=1280674 RepID=UPI0012DE01BC|nr:hypothetical protein [Prevotella sp. AGR2160]MDD5862002.1 hypothetical protein [Prevotella sp.]
MSAIMELALLTQQIAEQEKKMPQDAKTLAALYKKRGELLRQMGDMKGAEADARKFIALDPEAAKAMTGKFEAKGTE